MIYVQIVNVPDKFAIHLNTVKPVCNDHLFNKINYLSFIQKCDLMKLKVPTYLC